MVRAGSRQPRAHVDGCGPAAAAIALRTAGLRRSELSLSEGFAPGSCSFVGCCLHRRHPERSLDDLEECALFAQNESLPLCGRKILARFRIRLQSHAIALVGRQAVERNQPPGDVARALARQKISDQMTPAAWNDAAPILGVSLKFVSLERIDLVADEAGQRHGA